MTPERRAGDAPPDAEQLIARAGLVCPRCGGGLRPSRDWVVWAVLLALFLLGAYNRLTINFNSGQLEQLTQRVNSLPAR